jgi:hypothetical protein
VLVRGFGPGGGLLLSQQDFALLSPGSASAPAFRPIVLLLLLALCLLCALGLATGAALDAASEVAFYRALLQEAEVAASDWLPFAEGLGRLTFDGDRAALAALLQRLQ